MRRPSLETLAAVHAALLVVFASWAFGGNIAWARPALTALGAFAILITLAAIRVRLSTDRRSLRVLHLLWPLFGYNILVLLSTLQPAYTAGIIYDAPVLVPVSTLTAWPCSARPGESLRQLALLNALFLPAFNLLLAVRSRRILRTLLLAVAANALLLAIFGTLQKLVHAPGLFFGAVPSPNKTFFATFIYHNHWGAFVILLLAAILGLLFHETTRANNHRDFFHSPAFLGVVAALALAATAPLSTSRSSTALAFLLLTCALLHALHSLLRGSNRSGEHTRPACGVRRPAGHFEIENPDGIAKPTLALQAFALLLGTLIAAFAIFDLARPMIAARTADTASQLTAMRTSGGIGSRAQLYADTWRMAADRPWFGWGLGSYPTVFQRYNTQKSTDNLPLFYVDAHSDWLQSLAETGFTGTLLLGALLLIPAVLTLRRRPGPLPAYLIAGCCLVLLYAWIEFPFGCPAVVATFWLCLFAATRFAELDARERPARP